MEKWKDIEGYEKLYQVSNLGRIKTFNYKRSGKEAILKLNANTKGYLGTQLTKNGIQKSIKVHVLVAKYFIGIRPEGATIDHVDGNKTNNTVANLQYLSNRENVSKYHASSGKKTSKHVGVYWYNLRKKWVSKIRIGKKSIHLGYFDNEDDAHKEYIKQLNQVKS